MLGKEYDITERRCLSTSNPDTMDELDNKYYTDSVTWWERYVKEILRRSFTREGTERRRERRTVETFYYASIYDILDAPIDPGRKAITIKRLKTQITRLHHQQRQKILLDTEE